MELTRAYLKRLTKSIETGKDDVVARALYGINDGRIAVDAGRLSGLREAIDIANHD